MALQTTADEDDDDDDDVGYQFPAWQPHALSAYSSNGTNNGESGLPAISTTRPARSPSPAVISKPNLNYDVDLNHVETKSVLFWCLF